LSRIFRRTTGEGFAGYLRRVRLEQSCRLLLETDLSNEQIAYACGLRDVPGFYRLFKAQMGCTPREYRSEKSSAN
jgi:AraC-like DNA-binding protein